MVVTTKQRGVRRGHLVWMSGVINVVTHKERLHGAKVLTLLPVWRADHCRA